MSKSNYERMIQLAEDTFAVKNDPEQLDVNEEVIEHLQKIHLATVSEYDDGNGPAAWIIMIPTTQELMSQFLLKNISEKELVERTPLHHTYEAVYLCSAMVLEEYRRKGIAKKLSMNALEKIQKEHPIKSLFVWAFTKEGDLGSEALAKAMSLPLYKRQE